MTEAMNPFQEPDSVLDLTPGMVDALINSAARFGDEGEQQLHARLARLTPHLARLVEMAAYIDSPDDTKRRRGFLRGVLFTTKIVEFVEMGRYMDEVLEPNHSADLPDVIGVDVDAAPPRAAAPYGGRPTDVLFLAPPE